MRQLEQQIVFGISLVFILLFAFFKKAYIPINFVLILGLVILPFATQTVSRDKSIRYFILAIISAFPLYFYQSSTFYLGCFVCTILFVREVMLGRQNYLPLFIGLVISPMFQHLSNIWSFPIRLKMSEIVGEILSQAGLSAEVIGNVIYLNGFPYSVDPACMGLKMLSTACLLGIMILAYFERSTKRHFYFLEVSLAILIILFSAVLSNFCRLLLLVLFNVMPEMLAHDILGLLCLVIYVPLPFYFLVKWWTKFRLPFIKKISPKVKRTWFNKHHPLFKWGMILVLFILMVVQGIQFTKLPVIDNTKILAIEAPSFQKTVTQNGMLKLEKAGILIYLKPPVKPMQGSHDPRLCWKGSGYELKHIQIEEVENIAIYTAQLIQGKDVLHTAWWFDNGQQQTIKEWDWRWQTVKGNGGFYLINVTVAKRDTLLEVVRAQLQDSFIK